MSITIDVWHEHRIIARVLAKRINRHLTQPMPRFNEDDGSVSIGPKTWRDGEWSAVHTSDQTPDGYCAFFEPDSTCLNCHPDLVP